MQYHLLVQNPRPELFMASVLEMPDCAAQGRTEDEAVAAARAALEQRLNGGKIITLEIAGNGVMPLNPLLEGLGEFRDDPTYHDFLEQIAAYRRELDAEEAA